MRGQAAPLELMGGLMERETGRGEGKAVGEILPDRLRDRIHNRIAAELLRRRQ
jgi:hypothetical protein